jgi:hypothetical protein
MLSVTDLLKKSRCDFKELHVFLYTLTNETQTYDPTEYEDPIDDLKFFEHFSKNVTLNNEVKAVHRFS